MITIHELPTEIIESTAELIKSEKSVTIGMTVKQVIQIYHRRGFKVQNLHGDGQFEHIKKLFSDVGITINVTGGNEHVPAQEKTIRTIS